MKIQTIAPASSPSQITLLLGVNEIYIFMLNYADGTELKSAYHRPGPLKKQVGFIQRYSSV
jgi:hypothetical protein